jgi:hypothetical protein
MRKHHRLTPILMLCVGLLAIGAHPWCNALTLPIPKAVIDQALRGKFPKERYGIKLDSPVTRFKADLQKVELCGQWHLKVPPKSGEFCLDFRPLWNKEKADIEMSGLNILKFTAGDDQEIPAQTLQLLNALLLPLLDGSPIYHAPEMTGKFLEGLKVDTSFIDLIF